jgi:hypothetical protein
VPAPWPLVASYFLSALVLWLAAAAVSLRAAAPLAQQAIAAPEVLLAVHLIGLGFLPMAVVGAALHVLPMLLRAPARPARGWLALPLLAVGPLLAWAIAWREETWVRVGAAVLAAGVLIVAVDLLLLVRRAPGDRLLLVSRVAIVLAVVHACLALAAGLVLVERPGGGLVGEGLQGTLAVHVHLAALGWLTLLIVAVGRSLAPMLALAPAAPRRRFPTEETGLTVGLWALLAGLLAPSRAALVSGVALVLAALARFSLLLSRVGRRQRQPGLEGPLGHLLLGLVFLLQAAVLGLIMAAEMRVPPSRAAAYVIFLLLGWASGVTVGHVGKLLSLSLWSGWPPGPRPRQAALYPRRLWALEAALLGLAVELLAAGALLGEVAATQAGAALLASSAGVALLGALFTLSRRRLRPERHPLHFPAPARPAS